MGEMTGPMILGWTALGLTAAGTAYQVDRSIKDRRKADQSAALMVKNQADQIAQVNQDQANAKKQLDEENARADQIKQRDAQRAAHVGDVPSYGAGKGGRRGTILTGPMGLTGADSVNKGSRKSFLGS